MKMYSKGTRGNKQSSDWRFDCLLLPASLSGDIFSRRDREDERVSRLGGVKSISLANLQRTLSYFSVSLEHRVLLIKSLSLCDCPLIFAFILFQRTWPAIPLTFMALNGHRNADGNTFVNATNCHRRPLPRSREPFG